jgi:hypothetical protein
MSEKSTTVAKDGIIRIIIAAGLAIISPPIFERIIERILKITLDWVFPETAQNIGWALILIGLTLYLINLYLGVRKKDNAGSKGTIAIVIGTFVTFAIIYFIAEPHQAANGGSSTTVIIVPATSKYVEPMKPLRQLGLILASLGYICISLFCVASVDMVADNESYLWHFAKDGEDIAAIRSLYMKIRWLGTFTALICFLCAVACTAWLKMSSYLFFLFTPIICFLISSFGRKDKAHKIGRRYFLVSTILSFLIWFYYV